MERCRHDYTSSTVPRRSYKRCRGTRVSMFSTKRCLHRFGWWMASGILLGQGYGAYTRTVCPHCVCKQASDNRLYRWNSRLKLWDSISTITSVQPNYSWKSLTINGFVSNCVFFFICCLLNLSFLALSCYLLSQHQHQHVQNACSMKVLLRKLIAYTPSCSSAFFF